MTREVLFGFIIIVAFGIIIFGNKLSFDDGSYQTRFGKGCIIDPVGRNPNLVRNPVPKIATGIPKTPGSTWTYANNSYLLGYPKSVSNQRIT